MIFVKFITDLLFTWKNKNVTDLSKNMNKIVCIKGTFGQFTFGQQQDGGENTNMKKNENVMDQFRPNTRCFNNFSLNKK